jgi:phage antirepressor YoqD-like protein
MEKARKLTNKQFWAILRANAGLYARTARAITEQYNIPYTRQSVKERAEKNPELLADIEEENIDIAEEALQSLMRSKNERIKLQAVQLVLKTKGKHRGYIERTEVTGKDGESLAPLPAINIVAHQTSNQPNT